jgi:hypothetical protein
MGDLVSILKDTPVPTILVVGGLVFLALAVIRQITAHIKVESRGQQIVVAVIGLVLLVAGTALYASPGDKPASVTTAEVGSTPEAALVTPVAEAVAPVPTETETAPEPTRAEAPPTATSTPPPPEPTLAEPTPIGPAPASGTGNVQGRVLWNGQPVVDVEVKLCEKVSLFGGCSGFETGTRTDDGGRYLFVDIAPGQYSLVVQAPDGDRWLYITAGLGISAREYSVVADQVLNVGDHHTYKSDLRITDPQDESQVDSASLVLTWEAYPDAAYYELYLSPEKGNAIYTSHQVDDTQTMPAAPLVNCSYTWSVEAFNAQRIKIAETDGYYHFTVTGQAVSCYVQIAAPLDGVSVPGSGLILSWEPHPSAAYYKILMWNDTDPNRPKILDFVQVREPSYAFTEELDPARYVWSVHAYSESGDEIAGSQVYDFVVTGP